MLKVSLVVRQTIPKTWWLKIIFLMTLWVGWGSAGRFFQWGGSSISPTQDLPNGCIQMASGAGLMR